jgi:hypothetical protein
MIFSFSFPFFSLPTCAYVHTLFSELYIFACGFVTSEMTANATAADDDVKSYGGSIAKPICIRVQSVSYTTNAMGI